MEKNKSSGGRAGVMGGKGFYIVLLLCAAVLGITSWVVLSDAGTNVEASETAENHVDVSDAVVTMLPADTILGVDEPASAVMADALPPVAETDEPDAVEDEAEPDDTREVMSEAVVSYVWPIHGSVSAPYAVETLRYDRTMADWRTHSGIDIACEVGDPVAAAAAGTVVRAAQDDLYGMTVEIDHENGVHSIYANLAAEPPVAEGDVVTMGQVIGSVGRTALAETNETPHLHFSMTLDGIQTDPMNYLPAEIAS